MYYNSMENLPATSVLRELATKSSEVLSEATFLLSLRSRTSSSIFFMSAVSSTTCWLTFSTLSLVLVARLLTSLLMVLM